MALKGNLRDFSVTQILNLTNLARKTGTLFLDPAPKDLPATGQDGGAQMGFREGKLAYLHIDHEDNSLASILLWNKKISAAQHKTIQDRARQMTDKELGLLLINAGYLNREDVLNCLQTYYAEGVRKLFTWNEGVFRFEADALLPEDRILTRIDLENLIVEGARRIKEQEHLQEEIPSLDIALKFAERPGANIRKMNLSVDEWKVISFINPKNTINQIARAAKMNDLEIRRVVYALLQAGLVELVRQQGAVPPPSVRFGMPAASKQEQKGLVSRLINRIRSL